MKLTRSLLALAVNFSLILPAIFVVQAHTVFGQNSDALQRGYRTGYSDGYMAGYRDIIDAVDKSISRHREYEAADRAYNKDFGVLEDYRDGYRQGFEKGYETGFEKKSFDSTIPTNLVRKGLRSNPPTGPPVAADPPPTATQEETTAAPVSATITDNGMPSVTQKVSYSGDEIVIPKDTEVMLQLQSDVTTKTTREGEKFTARVVSPAELSGAIVEGRVERLQAPGRIKRSAELQLSFDRIVVDGNRWSNFSGLLVEVMPIQGDNVRRVTDEGTAIGQSSIKGDAARVGISTGAGAGIGAIAGGPVGAAVGAGIGAAYGIGSAIIERGKHIRLNKDQQIRVRTSYEVKIR